MAKASGGNQEVEIANHLSRLSQFPSFPAEKLADFPVHSQHREFTEKRMKAALILLRVSRIIDALIEFRQRDNAQGNTLRLKLPEFLGNYLDVSQMIDNPVGIHQITNFHNLASGRDEMRRFS